MRAVRRMVLALVACTVIAGPRPALAQNCALCYTQAASAGQRMITALRSGILILVVPPTLASVGMIFIVHRKRNQTRRREDGEYGREW